MYISLQILRALAAWAIVFKHILQSYYMGQADSIFWTVIDKVGGLGVDIFFVLSGFIMAYSSAKYNGQGLTFAVNRLIRVMPIYWVYTLLLIVSLILLPTGTYLAEFQWGTFIQSIFLIPHANPNGYGNYPLLYVGWTLTYEMFFYLILAIVLFFYFKHPIYICAGILLLITALTVNIDFLGKSSLLLIEFIIGMGIFVYFNHFKAYKANYLLALGIIGTITSFVIFGYKAQHNEILIVSLCVYLFVLCEPLFKKFEIYTTPLRKLGDYSYSTYLCHVIVIGWFYAAFGQMQRSVIVDTIIVIALLLTVLALSFISYHAIEKGWKFKKLTDKLPKH